MWLVSRSGSIAPGGLFSPPLPSLYFVIWEVNVKLKRSGGGDTPFETFPNIRGRCIYVFIFFQKMAAE